MKNKLEKKAWELVGFGVIQNKGRKLNEEEIETIANYAESCGAEREYVVSVLKRKGRPFDLYDPTLRKTCRICHAIQSYCCC